MQSNSGRGIGGPSKNRGARGREAEKMGEYNEIFFKNKGEERAGQKLLARLTR